MPSAHRLRATIAASVVKLDAGGDVPPGSVGADNPVSYHGALRGARKHERPHRNLVRAARAATSPAELERAEHAVTRPDARPLPVPGRLELEAPAREVTLQAVARQAAAAREGVLPWRLTERREGTRAARRAADRVADLDHAEAVADVAARQDQLDRAWDPLTANDPEVVLPTVEEALSASGLPGVALDVAGDRLTAALILDPPDEVVPERRPNVTPTGRSTLKKRTKTELNSFYLDLLAGTVVGLVREIAAAAPGVGSVVVVVCRGDRAELECVYVGELETRAVLASRSGAPPLRTIERAAILMEPRGRTEQLRPVDLAGEPAVSALVAELATALRGGGR